MSRAFIIAANWKMNKGPHEAEVFFEEFLKGTERFENYLFFISDINLHVAQKYLPQNNIGWGAQNIYFEEEGAFTGETSAKALSEFGATHVLIGHSERRQIFNESDEWVSQKVKVAQQFALTPVICVGETWPERQAGETQKIIIKQLKASLQRADLSQKIIVAYEPVWAIGTGQVASVEQAVEAHKTLRQALNQLKPDLGEITSILYGGSVKPENAKELSDPKDIDGFLVGGASLSPQGLAGIYDNSSF